MTAQDQTHLLAEQKFLNEQLSKIGPNAFLTRASLESRIKKVNEVLARSPRQSIETAKLTFRGSPVFGSHGITADFASKATSFFSDAVATVTASINESLSYMGPIPDRLTNQLLITNTAIGSFGFEFELPKPQGGLFPQRSKVEDAVFKVQELFRLAAIGGDDEINEIVQDIHPRAVRKVAEFLDYLSQQNAWCGLEFKDRSFKFHDIDQLKHSAERIREDNILQSSQIFTGEFQGVLPTGRVFEFKLSGDEGIIKGKVDISILNPDVINTTWLHRPVKVNLNVFQVGQSKPRYTLLSLDKIEVFNS